MPFEYTWVDLLIRQHVLLNVLHTISFGETQYAPLSASVNHSHPNPLAWSQYFIPLSRRVQHFKPVFKPSTFHTHQLLSALLSRSLPREIVPLLILSLLTCIYFLFYTLFFFSITSFMMYLKCAVQGNYCLLSLKLTYRCFVVQEFLFNNGRICGWGG